MSIMKRLIQCIFVLAALASAALTVTSCAGNKGKSEPVIQEGYVRHVILWTLSEELTPDEKLEVIGLAKSSMEKFEKEIDGLVKADVIFEKRLDSSNCDFMFDMYFKSRKALEEFSANPSHLAVVSQLKPFISGRTCLDLEL